MSNIDTVVELLKPAMPEIVERCWPPPVAVALDPDNAAKIAAGNVAQFIAAFIAALRLDPGPESAG